MTKRSGILLLIFACMLGLSGIMLKKKNEIKILQVLFPFDVFKKNDALIDPENLQTIYEYYLLENLSIGLVRDNIDQARGYGPGLASNWRQEDPYTWIFYLQNDSKWSNGLPISSDHIIELLSKLKNDNFRHITQMKFLEKIIFNQKENTLKLFFSKPTTSTILHELSLADAVLIKRKNLKRDWSITSGPYFIENYSLENMELILRKNPYCQLNNNEGPEIVRLFWFNDYNDFLKIFKEIKVDLFYMPPPLINPRLEPLMKNADEIYESFPTMIHYFKFNPSHHLFHNLLARKEFAYLIHLALRTFPGLSFTRETQLIPLGFSGRIKHYEFEETPIFCLRQKSIQINMHPAFSRIENFVDHLKKTFSHFKIDLKIDFKIAEENFKGDTENFAIATTFQGNQKEPLSSLSFLFSAHNKYLYPFKENLQLFFDQLSNSQNEKEESVIMEKMHKKVLDETYLVPFLVEKNKIALSSRIDLSQWNKFDTRMRFYLIKWK